MRTLEQQYKTLLKDYNKLNEEMEYLTEIGQDYKAEELSRLMEAKQIELSEIAANFN